ncbi:hypothetical protein, partial [Microlunatus capsulatus]
GVPADVDGGGPDVVLGLPSYDLPGQPDAGALVVLSDLAGPGEPLPQRVARRTLVTAADVGLPTRAGARFGAAVLVLRRPGGACADVVVGAPGEDVAGLRGAGRVHVLPGSPQGLGRPLETLDESRWPGLGGAQAGAGFGAALAGEDGEWLAVGVPRRDVAGVRDAGRVVRLDRRLAGTERVDVVQQGGPGAGAPEPGDRFGEVLHVAPSGLGPLLLVGVPHEDVGSRVDAGALALAVPGYPLTQVSQDSPGAGGAAEAGDRYGAAVSSWATSLGDHAVVVVAVGVPGEDVGRAVDAGLVGHAAVELFEASPTSAGPLRGRRTTVTQDSPGVPGALEAGDRFGAAVLSAELGLGSGRRHLVVGSPGEDLGGVVDAGALSTSRVDVATGATLAGTGAAWSQDAVGVAGRAERGDGFAASVAGVLLTRPLDDEDPVPVLLVTVPGEDDGAVPGTGMAHLGLPGVGSLALVPPVLQPGAGTGLVGARTLPG